MNLKPEKSSGLNGIRTYDLCDTGAVQKLKIKKSRFIFRLYFHSCLSCVYSCDDHWFLQLPVGLTAQLIEHCTSIAEVIGLNPIKARIFSSYLSQQFKYMIFHIFSCRFKTRSLGIWWLTCSPSLSRNDIFNSRICVFFNYYIQWLNKQENNANTLQQLFIT